MISNGISYYLNSFTPFTSTPMGSSLKNSPETSASEVAPVLVNGIDLHPRHVPEQPRQWCGSCERLVLWLALDQESLGRTMHWADQKQRILMMEKGWTTMEKWWKNDGTMMKNGKMMEQWWKVMKNGNVMGDWSMIQRNFHVRSRKEWGKWPVEG